MAVPLVGGMMRLISGKVVSPVGGGGGGGGGGGCGGGGGGGDGDGGGGKEGQLLGF